MVAHGALDRVRHLVEVAEQVLDAHRRELVAAFERSVQVGDVGSVVLVVVYLHRPRVDVGLECVERVGQIGNFVHE